ncbi:MAG: CDP-diacylglycerol--serine O-phosphatidyltransferase [Geminicoccaceae bacterium]|nr:CDP-diacylglycerol--serine O-phosphatidyltransferase [Geminicoccaceae bacterium]MCB9942510.1 CDP-diacylglycerol--serine O-phosphatidyltransferase [Geminicoccaceae bacterium]
MDKSLANRIRRRRLRPKPLITLVPNMFTVLGLCAGLTGMRYALDGRWQLAVGLIVAAIVFDGLDGRSARLLKLESKLGEQLDSLADFLSFGVAPAFVIYLWVLHDVRAIGWALGMLFATCCALRLARFNAELDDPDKPAWMHHFFTGIPAPAAAGLALTPMVGSFVHGDEIARNWYLNAVVLTFVAVMMVSRVPTYSIKKLRVSQAFVIPTLLAAGMLLVFLVTEPWATLLLIGCGYAFFLPVAYLHSRRYAAAPSAVGMADGEDGGGDDDTADNHRTDGGDPGEPPACDPRVIRIDKSSNS